MKNLLTLLLAAMVSVSFAANNVKTQGTAKTTAGKKTTKKKQAEEAPEEKVSYVVDYVSELEKRMQRHLGRRVKINVGKNKKTVTLFFEDNDDLDTLLRNICGGDFVENE